jgi:hypothetical protein
VTELTAAVTWVVVVTTRWVTLAAAAETARTVVGTMALGGERGAAGATVDVVATICGGTEGDSRGGIGTATVKTRELATAVCPIVAKATTFRPSIKPMLLAAPKTNIRCRMIIK